VGAIIVQAISAFSSSTGGGVERQGARGGGLRSLESLKTERAVEKLVKLRKLGGM